MAALGLESLSGSQLLLAQLGLTTLSAVLFLGSVIVFGMAIGAASSARRARREASDFAVEVRHLTAQVEQATARRASVPAAGKPEEARSASADQTAEQTVSDQGDGADRSLEEAKIAASVPSSLLRVRSRRRR